MDSLSENYREKWDAMRREYDAKADRLSAERRMENGKSLPSTCKTKLQQKTFAVANVFWPLWRQKDITDKKEGLVFRMLILKIN